MTPYVYSGSEKGCKIIYSSEFYLKTMSKLNQWHLNIIRYKYLKLNISQSLIAFVYSHIYTISVVEVY